MANQKGNAALRTALQQLLSQVRTLIPKYQKLKKENKNLSTELSDERKETGDLRIKLDGKTKENENLDKKVKELEGQRGSSQGDEAAIDATVSANHNLQMLTDIVREINRQICEHVFLHVPSYSSHGIRLLNQRSNVTPRHIHTICPSVWIQIYETSIHRAGPGRRWRTIPYGIGYTKDIGMIFRRWTSGLLQRHKVCRPNWPN
ncbi:hypothetical protein DPV78_011872 [Talaromyces pinophilus]|nr:hypothetical protein DPV78_011872 [Talaromyces pinophilus]